MAIDLCSTSVSFISPRISFSDDLNNQSSDSTTTAAAAATTTFDFRITSDILQQITSADELFFNGVLLPAQIKKHENLIPQHKSTNEAIGVHKKRLKELISNVGDDDDDEEQEKSSSRSFWTFKRTTSLNSDNGMGPKRLFRSLSLKRMLRSNSTDSALNHVADPKVIEKSSSRKESAVFQRCSSSVQSASLYYSYNGNNSFRKSIKKKSFGGGGIKINPILNIPPTFNMNSIGFGSLFCIGKPKIKS